MNPSADKCAPAGQWATSPGQGERSTPTPWVTRPHGLRSIRAKAKSKTEWAFAPSSGVRSGWASHPGWRSPWSLCPGLVAVALPGRRVAFCVRRRYFRAVNLASEWIFNVAFLAFPFILRASFFGLRPLFFSLSAFFAPLRASFFGLRKQRIIIWEVLAREKRGLRRIERGLKEDFLPFCLVFFRFVTPFFGLRLFIFGLRLPIFRGRSAYFFTRKGERTPILPHSTPPKWGIKGLFLTLTRGFLGLTQTYFLWFWSLFVTLRSLFALLKLTKLQSPTVLTTAECPICLAMKIRFYARVGSVGYNHVNNWKHAYYLQRYRENSSLFRQKIWYVFLDASLVQIHFVFCHLSHVILRQKRKW